MGLTDYEKYKVRRLQEKKLALRRPKPDLHWRTFVNVSNGENKFWKIGRESFGTVVHTEYGAMDTDGVAIRKRFDESWQAINYVAKKITEKLHKGYDELI